MVVPQKLEKEKQDKKKLHRALQANKRYGSLLDLIGRHQHALCLIVTSINHGN